MREHLKMYMPAPNRRSLPVGSLKPIPDKAKSIVR